MPEREKETVGAVTFLTFIWSLIKHASVPDYYHFEGFELFLTCVSRRSHVRGHSW